MPCSLAAPPPSTPVRRALVLGAEPSPRAFGHSLPRGVDVYSVNGVGLTLTEGAACERLVALCPGRYDRVRERCRVRPELEVFVGHPGRFAPSAPLLHSFGPGARPLRQLTWRRRSLDRWLMKLPVRAGLNAYLLNQREMAFDRGAGFNFQGGGVSVALQLAIAHGHRELLVYGLGTPEAHWQGPLAATKALQLRAALEPALVAIQIYLEPRAGRLVDCTPRSPLQFVQQGLLSEQLAAEGGRSDAAGPEEVS